MLAQSKYSEQVGRERSIAPFIPFSSLVTPTTVVTKDGDYMRTWRVTGIAFETADADEMLLRKDQLNTLWRSIASEKVAVWSHNVRRRTTDALKGQYDNAFCAALNEKYTASFAGYRMMANELYLTVLYRPNPGRMNRALVKSARRSLDEILKEQRAAIRKLDEIGMQVEAGLRRYGGDDLRGIEMLGEYRDEHGIACSSQLEFYNFLVSGEWQKVRVPDMPLSDYLGTAWLFMGTETLELRTPKRVRYAQAIDFKDYTAHTEPGLLNELMYSDYEYVMTQSFSFMAQRQGKEFLEKQGKRLRNAEDGSTQQLVQLGEALDQLIQGQFAMGEYHFSLLVFGDTVEKARLHTTLAMTTVQDRGFLASLVTVATDAAFFAQLPGNWSYRPRIAGLTSRNFAGLQSFHNFRGGKRDGNPWGEAISILKTPSGQPLYFNWHYAKGDEDQYDKKLLGNTRIIGASGTGKTVFLNFNLCMSQKYRRNAPLGYTTVFFDKDEGAKATILAIGGRYLSIKNGRPTGFNPFQLEPTHENLLFLERLVRRLAMTGGHPITTGDELRISKAVRTVMAMPKEVRRLSVVLQNIGEGNAVGARENSVAKRLSRWCADNGEGRAGEFAWVLDCETDMLDFTTHDNYGIDGTDFLDNEDVRSPISMYLLYRLNSVIDGRRLVYTMDEAWKWVDEEDSPEFTDFAGNKQLTIRKQNGLGVFATQMPSSLLRSKVASALVQQCATEVYLPNPKADYREYTEGFKLTDAEFQIVKSFAEDSRMFLIKQGHQSMIGRLDLSNVYDREGNVVVSFSDELAILSGSSDNNELLDAVIAEVGDDPEQWLPVFHERRKARVASSKQA